MWICGDRGIITIVTIKVAGQVRLFSDVPVSKASEILAPTDKEGEIKGPITKGG